MTCKAIRPQRSEVAAWVTRGTVDCAMHARQREARSCVIERAAFPS